MNLIRFTAHINELKPALPTVTSKRYFWAWLNNIWNSVDEDRRKIVGPDRSCAEWLLRNGGAVVWTTGKSLSDYNSLPSEEETGYYIKEVNATGSSITHVGFRHFANCKHVDKLILHDCVYIDDKALEEMHYLKETLKYLQISKCFNVTEKGLTSLKILKRLEQLILFDFPYVKDLPQVAASLKEGIPGCEVHCCKNLDNATSL